MATPPILAKCALLNTSTSALTLIKEDAHTDASFLISTIIGQRLRVANTAIILVCAHHNFQHYASVGQRLGYNLKPGTAHLQIIDVCNDIAEHLANNRETECEPLIAQLWRRIEDGVRTAKQNSSIDKITIIIDDLIFFKLFGCTDNHLIKLCELLVGLFDEYADLAVSMVVKVSDYLSNQHICRHIEERASVVLTADALKSGNFKHVDGQIRIHEVAVNDSTADNYDNGRKILYKINDRNVKIFMPGEHALGGMKI